MNGACHARIILHVIRDLPLDFFIDDSFNRVRLSDLNVVLLVNVLLGNILQHHHRLLRWKVTTTVTTAHHGSYALLGAMIIASFNKVCQTTTGLPFRTGTH